MNKSPQYNQQSKSEVEEICIYQNMESGRPSQHLYLKINSGGVHTRKNPKQQYLKVVTFSDPSKAHPQRDPTKTRKPEPQRDPTKTGKSGLQQYPTKTGKPGPGILAGPQKNWKTGTLLLLSLLFFIIITLFSVDFHITITI